MYYSILVIAVPYRNSLPRNLRILRPLPSPPGAPDRTYHAPFGLLHILHMCALIQLLCTAAVAVEHLLPPFEHCCGTCVQTRSGDATSGQILPPTQNKYGDKTEYWSSIRIKDSTEPRKQPTRKKLSGLYSHGRLLLSSMTSVGPCAMIRNARRAGRVTRSPGIMLTTSSRSA